MKSRRIPGPLLMLISIMGIAAFLFYWLTENYKREEKTLRLKTDMVFREEMMKLQVARLKLGKSGTDSTDKGRVRVIMGDRNRGPHRPEEMEEEVVSSINIIRDKLADSMVTFSPTGKKPVMITMQTSTSFDTGNDSMNIEMNVPPVYAPGNPIFSFLYGVDSLQDSIRVTEIDSVIRFALQKEKIGIPFTIIKSAKSVSRGNRNFGSVTIGLKNPQTYSLAIGNSWPFLVKRIAMPVIFSLLLLGITIAAFLVLYKNLRKQRKLAELKNEFISNITHELKTPIATVGVAIEALKNFNAIDNPERTREYLDISQNELHRLSLLVDKVLKLSMFENQGIELKYETLNLRGIVTEVVESLKLQLEKFKATVDVQYNGETELRGDRLHLLSVVFNLLDNALKYRSTDKEVRIEVQINGTADAVQLIIRDNGIGISPEYQEKIFEKFFRVPHGDTHNAKGYGLGLSYVAQVIKKHEGTITVQSVPGESTAFTITLPKSQS